MNFKQFGSSLQSLMAIMVDPWKYVADRDVKLLEMSHFSGSIGARFSWFNILTTGWVAKIIPVSPCPALVPFCLASVHVSIARACICIATQGILRLCRLCV